MKSVSKNLIFFTSICLLALCRFSFSYTIRQEGVSIVGWGDNSDHLVSSIRDRQLELPIESDRGSVIGNFDDLSMGPYTALSIGPDGKVYCWGKSFTLECGAIGIVDPPIEITGFPSGKTVHSVHAAYGGSFFLMSDGSLYGIGIPDALNAPSSSSTPTPISFNGQDVTIKHVSTFCDDVDFLAIDSTGQGWVWGKGVGDMYSLSQGNTKFEYGVTSADNSGARLIDDQGQLWKLIMDSLPPTPFKGPQPFDKVTHLAFGNGFILASDGRGVKSIGDDTYASLGRGAPVFGGRSAEWGDVDLPEGFELQALSAGDKTGFALNTLGELYAWGEAGELGIDAQDNVYTPTKVSYRGSRFENIKSSHFPSLAAVEFSLVLTVVPSSSKILRANDMCKLTVEDARGLTSEKADAMISFRSRTHTSSVTYSVNFVETDQPSFPVPNDLKDEPYDIVVTMDELDESFRIPLNNAFFQADVNTQTGGWINPNEPIPLRTMTNLQEFSEIQVHLETYSAGNSIPVTLTSDTTIELPGDFEWSAEETYHFKFFDTTTEWRQESRSFNMDIAKQLSSLSVKMVNDNMNVTAEWSTNGKIDQVMVEIFQPNSNYPVLKEEIENDGSYTTSVPVNNLEEAVGETFRAVITSSKYDTSVEAEFTISDAEDSMSSMSGALGKKPDVVILLLVFCSLLLLN